MEKRKRKRRIRTDGVEKYKNRYSLSRMLICPHCCKTLRRKQVYNKSIEWRRSTYITKVKSTCKRIKTADEIKSKKNITEQTVIDEVRIDGKKYYSYTSKADYHRGMRNKPYASTTKNASVLPRVNRQRRTAIKL